MSAWNYNQGTTTNISSCDKLQKSSEREWVFCYDSSDEMVCVGDSPVRNTQQDN